MCSIGTIYNLRLSQVPSLLQCVPMNFTRLHWLKVPSGHLPTSHRPKRPPRWHWPSLSNATKSSKLVSLAACVVTASCCMIKMFPPRTCNIYGVTLCIERDILSSATDCQLCVVEDVEPLPRWEVGID